MKTRTSWGDRIAAKAACRPRASILSATFLAEAGSTSRRPASTLVNGSLIGGTVPKSARGRNDIQGIDVCYAVGMTLLALLLAAQAANVPELPKDIPQDAVKYSVLMMELELDAEAGIPAPEVVRLATLGAARIMGMEKDLGTVRPGKLADLVLIDGDPARRISDVRRTVLTVKDGVVYRPAELYRELGVRPTGQ
jgi:hypothetical protein